MLHDLSRQLRRLMNEATRSNAEHSDPTQPAPEGNVIRLRNTSNDWQKRSLTKLGARMHATSVERGDGCSIAILDNRGLVVAWHDTLPGAATLDFGVIGIHVSQFYLPQDVAFQRPNRRLDAACLNGTDTQQGWHRRPDGSIFWGVTVIEARRLQSGELHGYSHVTRRSQDPHERVLADVRRPPRQYSPCFGAVAVA
jgi:hypothetical protein